jgi:hypothetical protein
MSQFSEPTAEHQDPTAAELAPADFESEMARERDVRDSLEHVRFLWESAVAVDSLVLRQLAARAMIREWTTGPASGEMDLVAFVSEVVS